MNKKANGEGSVVPHGRRKWKAIIVIGYRDGDPNKPIRRTRTRASRAEARRKLEELKLQYFGGGISDRVTVREFFNQWMTENESRLRNNSCVSYRSLMENHILPRIGKQSMEELRPVEVMQLVNSLTADNVGASTIHHAIKAARSMFKRALQLQVCSTNPFVGARLPKVTKKKIEPFTASEVRRIINNAYETRLPGFWRLAFHTGMRFSEISALTWEDIDFDALTVTVQRTQTLQPDKSFAVEEITKTSAGRRTISVGEDVLYDLNEQRKLNLFNDRHQCGYVFPSQTKKSISPQSFHRYDWKPLLETLKIQHRGFHHVRHTFATQALGNKIEITTVSKMLGHATVAETLRTYAHAIPEKQVEAAAVIGRMYG